MKSQGHNLLVFFQHAFISEKEEEYFQQIILQTGTPEQFSVAHELVDRNRITSNKRKIIGESLRAELRPFRFFINKN